MTPESFQALTGRNEHPSLLLSPEGVVVAANPRGCEALGRSSLRRGGFPEPVDLRTLFEGPTDDLERSLATWAAAGVPTSRTIRLRGPGGSNVRYRAEGLRITGTGQEAGPLVLLHLVPMDPLPTGRGIGDPRFSAQGLHGNGSGSRLAPPSTPGPAARKPAAGPARPGPAEREVAPADDDGSGTHVAPPATERSARAPAEPRQVGKMEAMGNLAAGIAHDFNNLLTVMKVEIELVLEHEDLPAQVVDSVLAAHAAVTRAESLVTGLLAFSRRQLVRTTETDLRKLLDDALPKVHAVLGSIALEVDRAPEPLPVVVSPAQVETVLLALVRNAVEALEDGGGKVWLRTRRERTDAAFVRANPGSAVGDFAVLEVEDEGVGIAPEVSARMFEPFFTTKGRGYGRGLGLAQAYGIVKALDGYLKVDSAVGAGSTFSVYLPVRAPEGGA